MMPGTFTTGTRRLAVAGLLTFAFASASTPSIAQKVQFLPNNVIVAGTGANSYTGDGGPATSASFIRGMEGASMDPFGNIYVADSNDNVIRRIDGANGIITSYVGGATANCTTTPTGVAPDAFGNGCLANQTILKAPESVRYFKGSIYIADSGNNEIRAVNLATGVISAFAGNGTAVLATAGAATSISVDAPQDVNFDAAGNAYIATGGGKPVILRVDTTGNATIIAGNGTAANTGDGGPATAAEIQTPIGVAVDPQGNVYFSGSTPNNIREINITTGIISTYVGSTGLSTGGFAGDGGPASLAQLHTPQHIAFDVRGNLYIADQANQRVRMVTPPSTGSIISTISGTGTASNSPSGTLALNANLNQIRGVDLTPAGDLIFSDGYNAEIKIYTPPVNYPTTAVGSMAASVTASARVNTALTLGSLGIPAAYTSFAAGSPVNCIVGGSVAATTICSVPVTFQPKAAGVLGAPLVLTDTVGDTYTLALQGIGSAPVATVLPGIVGAVAGTGTAGNSGDNAAATAAKLNAPLAVAVDALGNYFFADSANNEVREISTTGTITRVAGTGTAAFSGDGAAATLATLSAPSGLAIDGAGNLYIADTGNNRIRMVSNGTISTFAGTGTAAYTGDNGLATSAAFNAPKGLFVNSGLLYVADTGNNVVRIIGVRSSAVTTIAGTGVAGYTGDSGLGSFATLAAPSAVAVDNSGNIYIADTANRVIRRVTNGVITTFAGSGNSGISNGAAATASFVSPVALAVDAAGDVYVADTGNNAIRRVASGQVTTVAGTGTAGSTGNGGNSSLATFTSPQGVALDGSGNIVIADTGNNLIRNVNVSSSKLVFPTTSPNTASAPLTVSLTNSGNLPLTVASVTVPANFAEQASGGVDCNTAGLMLAVASSCQASIVFQPTASLTYSGNVVFTDNSQSAATATQSVAVSGVSAFVYTASISAPATATAAVVQTVTVSVTNPSAVYTGTIHFTSSDPKAVLPANYTFTTADNGKHVFTTVQFGTAGIQTIGVTDTVTTTITATALVTVIGGPPATLAIVSGTPQSANIGLSYGSPLVVKVTDSLGNPSTGATVTFTAPSTNADVTFAGLATYTGVTNSLGTVTTPTPIADAVTGTFTVSAVVTGLPAVSFSLTNTSTMPAGFSLISTPLNIISLPPGGSASTLITLMPQGGFNAAVNLTCSGAVNYTTCSVNPTSLPATGNGSSSTFTLTVTAAGPASASLSTKTHGTVYACLLLFIAGTTLRGRKRLRGILMALFCCLALAGLSGCGSSTGNPSSSVTLPQVFTITVTGTSGTIVNSTTVNCYVAGVI